MVGFFRETHGSFGDGKSSFGRRNFNRSGGFRRKMHKATCAECGKECEVPFKPRDDKPVYCLDCFKKRQSSNWSIPRLAEETKISEEVEEKVEIPNENKEESEEDSGEEEKQ